MVACLYKYKTNSVHWALRYGKWTAVSSSRVNWIVASGKINMWITFEAVSLYTHCEVNVTGATFQTCETELNKYFYKITIEVNQNGLMSVKNERVAQNTLWSKGRGTWGSWSTKLNDRTHYGGAKRSQIIGLAKNGQSLVFKREKRS